MRYLVWEKGMNNPEFIEAYGESKAAEIWADHNDASHGVQVYVQEDCQGSEIFLFEVGCDYRPVYYAELVKP
jgi:hypothetical protein